MMGFIPSRLSPVPKYRGQEFPTINLWSGFNPGKTLFHISLITSTPQYFSYNVIKIEAIAFSRRRRGRRLCSWRHCHRLLSYDVIRKGARSRNSYTRRFSSSTPNGTSPPHRRSNFERSSARASNSAAPLFQIHRRRLSSNSSCNDGSQ